MDAQTIRARITALEALADPNRKSTPEHERAAAERMLDKYRKLLAEQAGEVHTSRYSRWYGERYAETKSLRLTEIAKLIRAEVKLARKLAKLPTAPGALKLADAIGDAPAEIKISVRTEYYSGGGAINVSLSGIPQEWGWEMREDRYGYVCEMPTPALKALAEAIKAIMNSYNYDGSDTMTDYFDVRFYGHVSANGGRILA